MQAFKLTLKNFGKFTTKLEVEKFLKSNGVAKVKAVRKGMKADVTVISFQDALSRAEAQTKLQELSYLKTGQLLEAKLYTPPVPSFTPGAEDPTEESVADRVAPLRLLSYDRQLFKKQKSMLQSLKKIKRETHNFETRQCKKKIDELPKWLHKDYMKHTTVPSEPPTKKPKLSPSEQAPTDPITSKTPAPGTRLQDNEERRLKYKNWNVGEIPGACCPIEQIKPSPVLEGYRNKCAFTIGIESGKDSKTDGSLTGDNEKEVQEMSEQKVNENVVVGFRLGRFVNNSITVARPSADCMTCSKAMIELCLLVENYIKQSSLPAYSMLHRNGFWRDITVRSSTVPRSETVPKNKIENADKIETEKDGVENSKVAMSVILQCRSDGAPEMQREIDGLANVLRSFDSQGHFVESFSVDFYNGTSVQDDAKPVIQFGPGHLMEKLGNLSYRISPTAFFQTNTLGAEVLYNVVQEHVFREVQASTTESKSTKVDLPKWNFDANNVVLLDVCCGTGTIGLSMAHKVKHVIGIELSKDAIRDARYNAKHNGIDNALFVAQAAEHIIPQMITKRQRPTPKDEKHNEELDEVDVSSMEKAKEILSREDITIIAVVDPPRAGLHPAVIKALRQSNANRLVYVSCNPSGSFIDDARGLCASKNSKKRPGTPFTPVISSPVDMIPHTAHCELVTTFERKL